MSALGPRNRNYKLCSLPALEAVPRGGLDFADALTERHFLALCLTTVLVECVRDFDSATSEQFDYVAAEVIVGEECDVGNGRTRLRLVHLCDDLLNAGVDKVKPGCLPPSQCHSLKVEFLLYELWNVNVPARQELGRILFE